MPLGAVAMRAPAISEASTGITFYRDPAVEEQQPASIRRQDLRVEMAVWVWEHMRHTQAAYHRSAHMMEYLLLWQLNAGMGDFTWAPGAYPVPDLEQA